MKQLEIVQFGNRTLRQNCRQLRAKESNSDKVKSLITNMRHTLISKKLGVALAAPQVGQNISLFVIAVRPNTLRPNAKKYDLVAINPKIIEFSKSNKAMWEGCISSGDGKAGLFAKVVRHNRVTLSYVDEKGTKQQQEFKGLRAQIIQHETDHLNGILFVDRVTDTKTYMTYSQYLKSKNRGSLI